MSKRDIILVGGGGHCRSVIDVIEAEDKYKIVGIVDVKERLGDKILGYEVIASDDEIEKLSEQCRNFIITVGQIKSPLLRKELFKLLKFRSVHLPVIISPYARVSKYSVIGEGSVVMHYAIVNAGSKVGENCIINTASIVEHDVVIGRDCHISTGATINGGCTIGDECFIGSGATVVNGKNVESGTIVGAGATITSDILIRGVYVGTPAKRIHNNG